ncbi:Uncharacterised protein [Bordetella ansorpii]|uniref:Uncharacterized protein n=1 Tax=Bordetella ansorpii TaxID=288768 RepID=A0A157SVX3_9BORD|nr:hypothetical protein [Bordetella ansorpii]SAI74597.1 Uncharacterised protein [Bordetella ansorpii]
MAQTRAQALGLKPNILANRIRRRLARMQAEVQRLADPWDGIDGSVEGAANELQAAIARFGEHISGSVEYLNEVVE